MLGELVRYVHTVVMVALKSAQGSKQDMVGSRWGGLGSDCETRYAGAILDMWPSEFSFLVLHFLN